MWAEPQEPRKMACGEGALQAPAGILTLRAAQPQRFPDECHRPGSLPHGVWWP